MDQENNGNNQSEEHSDSLASQDSGVHHPVEKKHIAVGAAVVVVLVAGIWMYFDTLVIDDSNRESAKSENIEKMVDKNVISYSDIEVPVRHRYENGIHSFTGTIDVPTPCHSLHTSTGKVDADKETVKVEFLTESEVEACVQVLTAQSFKVAFLASEAAVVHAFIDGERINFKVSEVESEEALNQF